MLIPKNGHIGYCNLCKGKDKPELEAIKRIRGIKTLSSMLVPVIISASII
jgi:hypothetical protein